MEQNYYLSPKKTFLMQLYLTWAEYAIKILNSEEVSAIFETSKEVSAAISNLQGGFYNCPFNMTSIVEKPVIVVMEIIMVCTQIFSFKSICPLGEKP